MQLKDPLAAKIADQLGTLRKWLDLDEESLWPFEATDAGISVLIDEVGYGSVISEEIASATKYIDTIRGLLSALSHIVERSSPKGSDVPGVVADENYSARNLNRKLLAYEVVNGRTRLRSAPLRHVVHTTTRCNLRCLTCFQSASQDFVHYDIADIPRSALKPAVRLVQQVMVAGTGEPLLSRSASAIIAEYKQAGAYVEVITNGTTLPRESNLLSVIDVLLLSFDGGTDTSYNALRRRGNFERLVAKIADLPSDQKKKICLNFVVSKQNIYTAEDCLKLAVKLQLGQVHFQEMTGYLPWHDRMLIGDAERAWFFCHFPHWAAAAEQSDVRALCHLVPPTKALCEQPKDSETLTIASIAAVADVPVAKMPARMHLAEISSAMQALLSAEVPVILTRLSKAVRKLRPGQLPPLVDQIEPSQALASEQTALSFLIQNGIARLPHCLSTYAHLLINEDGTTRSCCKVQSRLASISTNSFDEIRNSPSNVELRRAHAMQIAPRRECVGCRDPLRFHFLAELLGELKADGVDISRIRKSNDFPVPASMADHPLIKELGSGTAAEAPNLSVATREAGLSAAKGD